MNMLKNCWKELSVSIEEVESLLKDYDVEVLSPDGYVKVTKFIDKGQHEEHIVTLNNGYNLRCSSEHLFETDKGWKTATELLNTTDASILVDTGDLVGVASVENTKQLIPIVDISVLHENHRYYANGISSHNCGKTLGLISLAADYIRRNQNVLYITLEVREEEILKRVDANMLDVSINELSSLTKDRFMTKIEKIKSKQHGKLKVKEFPPGTASAAHIKHIMKELKLKQGFEPHILIIDYLGLCASSRIKPGTQNSYFYLKAVAEELRALAVEHDIVCWTAAQFSRGGQANSDAEITDVAESHGLSATADFMVGMNRTEELDEAGALQFKQLKNRYGNKTNHLRFLVGVDLEKQKLYEMSSQTQVPKYPTDVDNNKLKKKFDNFEV